MNQFFSSRWNVTKRGFIRSRSFSSESGAFKWNFAVLTCRKQIGPFVYQANLWSLLNHLPVQESTESGKLSNILSLHCVCVSMCILTAILISMKESLGEPCPILSWSSEFNATKSFFSACRRPICPLSASSSACKHYGRYLTSVFLKLIIYLLMEWFIVSILAHLGSTFFQLFHSFLQRLVLCIHSSQSGFGLV